MMETSEAFGTISQAEHEAKSIRRFIHRWPGLGGLDIWVERAKSLSRPALGLVEVSRPTPLNRGRIMQGSEAEWQIDVMGPDDEDFNFWATKRLTDSIQGALWQAQLIPVYFFDWCYPVVKSMYVGDAEATVKAKVGVVAQDPDGGLSMAGVSEVMVPEVPSGVVEVVWPEYPSGSGWAARFKVYYDDVLWRTKLVKRNQEWYRTTLVLADGPDEVSDDTPPASSTIFARRFMRLSGISSRMLEHPEREGVWNGVITFQTCCDVSRLDKPGLTVANVPEVIERIESRVSVTT
ncbi:MAG: hypothetical protein OXH01_04145 [Bacteroidetes bacterium]|nr:hypothetical protein [Bacteroidota bacterium]